MFCLRQLTLATCTLSISLVVSIPAFARPLEPITRSELDTRLSQITHVPWDGVATERDTGGSFGCTETQVELMYADRADGERKPLTIQIIHPSSDDPVPAVLVIPTILGTTVLEPTIGNRLCRAGMAALIANVNDTSIPEEMPSWGAEDLKNRRALVALRTALDYAERSPRFIPTKLAVMGSSMGGITSALLAALEPERLKAVIINVGSGNFPYVLAYSDNGTVSDLRRRRMEYMKTDDQALYENELRRSIHYDPIYFAPNANRERILMITASRDTAVPTVAQNELFTALREPSHIIYDAGHVDAIISLVFFRMGEVVDFLNSRFEGQRAIFTKRLQPENVR